MFSVRLSTKGQIVIPKEIRERFNLQAGDQLTIELQDGMLILKRTDGENWRRWRGFLKETSAIQEHEQEHQEEVSRETGP